jgi:hypothetical protein
MIGRRKVFYQRYGRSPLESGSGHQLFYESDGTIVDRFRRPLEEVRTAARLADLIAKRSSYLSDEITTGVDAGTLELAGIAGRRLVERYRYNAHLLNGVALRDNEIARLLAEAGYEDVAAHAAEPHVLELEEARRPDAEFRAPEDTL